MTDARRETRVLVWICLLVGINQMGFGAIVPALPVYAQSFGVSASAIGMAVGIYGLARFFAAAPAGGVADRYGRRMALTIGGAVTLAGNLWCVFAVHYPEFLAARFLTGAGAGLIVTTGQIVVADISAPERRGRMLSIYMSAFIFGLGIGPLPGGVLSEHFGLAAPFYAGAITGLLAAVLAWFAIPETRDMARAAAAQSKAPKASYWWQVYALARQRGFVLVCLINLMSTASRTGGLFALVPLIGTERLHLSVQTIGTSLAAGLLAGLLGAYPSGMLVDYFGRKAVIVPSNLIFCAAMLMFCVADSYAWFLAACLIWGAASSIGGSAPTAYAADSAPPGMNATTLSTYRMVGDLGYILGPVLLGMLADWFGAVTSLVAVSAVMASVGVIFAVFAPETYRRKR